MKLSIIIENIIKKDKQLEFYISNRLLNLSQFAKYIKPLISAKVDKDIPVTTIVMALSRIQKKSNFISDNFKIGQINLYTELSTLSFDKTPEVHQRIQELFNKAMLTDDYFTISQGTREITIICKKAFIDKQEIPTPKFKHMNLSAISIQFHKDYLYTPGFMTAMLHKLTMQNINFIEISSTCTEMTCYIDHSDLKLAFDTLHHYMLA